MSINVNTPPALTGTSQDQLKSIYSYLYQLSELLNAAGQELDDRTVSIDTRISTQDTSVREEESKRISSIGAMRDIINDSATAIRVDMQSIVTTLLGSVGVKSELGEYAQAFSRTIEDSARGTIDSYDFRENISMGEWIDSIDTTGYIKQGYIETDSSGVPKIGIAIGQEISSKEQTISGEKQWKLTANNALFLTADRLSFRINGREQAYMTGGRMYITDAEIINNLTIGKWQVSSTSGGRFRVKWTG